MSYPASKRVQEELKADGFQAAVSDCWRVGGQVTGAFVGFSFSFSEQLFDQEPRLRGHFIVGIEL